ncbi:MAG: alpha/beta fold hydrolase [Planctomycetota bacterium]
MTRFAKRTASSLRAGSILAVVLGAVGCTLPGPRASSDARRAIETFDYTAPTGRVHARRLEAGDGPREIYVHGSPGDATAWDDFVLSPALDGEAVAIDRPGFGCSQPRVAVHSLALQAAAVEPLLEARGGRWPVLVGHSLGGPIVARVAAEHPGRVAGLVIVAGSVDPGLEELRWYNRLAAGLAVLTPRPLRNSNDEMYGLRPELEELEPLLARITCPVLVVHGREDGLVPFANVAFLRRALVNAERVEELVFDDAGHMLIWEPERADAIATRMAALFGAERG